MNAHTRSKTVAACVTAVAALLLGTYAHADGAPKRLTLSVIIDADGGPEVLKGKYAQAIKQLTAGFDTSDTVGISTNLCVALIMSRQWEAAQVTCDKAVSYARFSYHDSNLGGFSGRNATEALAYSNRAVLDSLTSRPEAAKKDVARAHALDPRTEFVSQNWLALNGQQTGPVIAAVAR